MHVHTQALEFVHAAHAVHAQVDAHADPLVPTCEIRWLDIWVHLPRVSESRTTVSAGRAPHVAWAKLGTILHHKEHSKDVSPRFRVAEVFHGGFH